MTQTEYTPSDNSEETKSSENDSTLTSDKEESTPKKESKSKKQTAKPKAVADSPTDKAVPTKSANTTLFRERENIYTHPEFTKAQVAEMSEDHKRDLVNMGRLPAPKE